jgi:hypothetical protein
MKVFIFKRETKQQFLKVILDDDRISITHTELSNKYGVSGELLDTSRQMIAAVHIDIEYIDSIIEELIRLKKHYDDDTDPYEEDDDGSIDELIND